MLLSNGLSTNVLPISLLGMGRQNFVHGTAVLLQANSSGFSKLSAYPDGYYFPHALIPPRSAGRLSSKFTIYGAGSASATGQSGRNLDGTLYISGSGGVDQTQTFLGLIVTIAATAGQVVGAGGVSSATLSAITNLVATISGSCTISAAAAGLAALAALIEGEGLLDPNNTALMDVSATLRGYSELTPEGIRDNVWSAILANYDDAGTAGKALSTASSGGVDLDALATAVWAYATRSMTAAERDSAAAAMLAAAQITPIHADARQVNGTDLDGTGQASDPWRPA